MKASLVVGAATAASLLAALAGCWILFSVKWENNSDALSKGIGFYFLAKAFFLGPMLYLVDRRARQPAAG